MKKKELVKAPSEVVLSNKKPSKWNFITRFFKHTPKVPKVLPPKRSKSKDGKIEYPNQSAMESVKKEDYSSFIQNYHPVAPFLLEKIKDDSPPETTTRLNKDPIELQNPISKIFENGGFTTPDKKFLKKFTGMIDIKDFNSFEKEREITFENSNADLTRPKKPLDSTRNKVGGLKYRNNLEKFQRNIERKFSFSYREKSMGELLFNLNVFTEILNYFSMESLLSFSLISKKFHSNEYHYQRLIQKRMMFLLSKVLFYYIKWLFIYLGTFEKHNFRKR